MKKSVAAFAALALVLCASSASASQFVVTDASYTHSPSTTKDSHRAVEPLPAAPPSWRVPVNYASDGGSAHVRLEVKTKPSDAPTKFQICFIIDPSYACTAQSPTYTKPGIVEWDTPLPEFFQYSEVDWSKPVSEITLILKDDKNVKPAPENVGAERAAMFMPSDVRITVTIVSPGDTYKAPAEDGGTPPNAGVDSGVEDTGEADEEPSEASPESPSDDGTVSPARSRRLRPVSTDQPSCVLARPSGDLHSAAPLLLVPLLFFVARRRPRRRRGSFPTEIPPPHEE